MKSFSTFFLSLPGSGIDEASLEALAEPNELLLAVATPAILRIDQQRFEMHFKCFCCETLMLLMKNFKKLLFHFATHMGELFLVLFPDNASCMVLELA